MCAVFKELLFKPTAAIERVKRKKNWSFVFSVLLLEWLFIALGNAVLVKESATNTQLLLLVDIILLFGLSSTLFGGILVKIIFRILGGKGEYFEGLVVATYPNIYLAVGILISSLLVLLPFGTILAFLVIAVCAAASVAVFFKSAQELFKVDLVTSFVGIVALIVSLVLSFYIVFMMYGTINPQFFSILA